jgi:glycosyltransferase involved in cell wall biosynthesis
VPAVLDPYHIGDAAEAVTSHSITSWNYRFQESRETILERSENDIDVLEIIEPNTYSFSGTYGINLQEEVAKYAEVAQVIAANERFDVIHAHDWMTFPAGIEAKKISGKPLVIHVHATEIDRSGTGFGKVFEIEKQGMDAADRIVAVSEWTKKILVSHYGIHAEKIDVVHNGINPAEPTHESNGQMMGSHVITFLGRVTQQKGPRYFVEAARKVSEKFPDAHFVIAGSGDLLPQTIDRVAQLRLSKKFHFTGFLTSDWISRIWSISNVYVMPSVSEPFGITPLEAMQAGVPVIVSNQSGVSEVLPHALKVNFWDTDALAEAICSVLQYRSLSAMLKQKGQNELQRLTWRSAAKKLNKIYHEIKT